MHKLLFALILCLISTSDVQAQTKGQDWTKNDCNGNPHNLFAEIDAGYVIVLEYVMIPSCQPCIIASHAMEPMISRLKAAKNNMVSYYAIGYTNSYSCAQMTSWAVNQNILATALFDQGSSDVSYYGGMGMPTIVVLGKGHRITYLKQGFTSSDTTLIREAINDGFNWGAGINNMEAHKSLVSVSPNPVLSDIHLTIDLLSGQDLTVSIYDVLGKEVMNVHLGILESGLHSLRIPIDKVKMENGVYFIRTNIAFNPLPVKFCVSN